MATNPLNMMNDEQLRKNLDEIGRSIQSVHYGEHDDSEYQEEIDRLIALIHEERRGAVLDFCHKTQDGIDAIEWEDFAAEAQECGDAVVDVIRETLESNYPPAA